MCFKTKVVVFSHLLEFLAALVFPHLWSFPTPPSAPGPFLHRDLPQQSSSLSGLVTCISSTCHMVGSRDILKKSLYSGRKHVCGGLCGLPQTPSREQSLTAQETLWHAASGHLPAFRQEGEGSVRGTQKRTWRSDWKMLSTLRIALLRPLLGV